MSMKIAVLLILAGAVLGISAGLAEEKGRYNVLFLISDDLTYTALSCYGNEVCRTPNIDAIARLGPSMSRTAATTRRAFRRSSTWAFRAGSNWCLRG